MIPTLVNKSCIVILITSFVFILIIKWLALVTGVEFNFLITYITHLLKWDQPKIKIIWFHEIWQTYTWYVWPYSHKANGGHPIFVLPLRGLLFHRGSQKHFEQYFSFALISPTMYLKIIFPTQTHPRTNNLLAHADHNVTYLEVLFQRCCKWNCSTPQFV